MTKRIAIIMYGLTKSLLKKTIVGFEQHLFNVLKENSFNYDIFIHTYKINGSYTNMWTGEHVNSYIEDDIDNILKPSYYIYDNQHEIESTINFNEYYKQLGNWTGMTTNMTKYLIRNMCLALYSKKRIVTLFETYKDKYDYAIIIRPDLLLENQIDIKWFSELNNTNIIIPKMHSFAGCNDRLCIGTVDVILYYGKLFDSLKEYSRIHSIIAEKYCLDMLTKKKITIITKDILYEQYRIYS